MHRLNDFFKKAYSALFPENFDFPPFLLNGTLSPDLAMLLATLERDLSSDHFETVAEFEQFIDSLLFKVRDTIVRLEQLKDRAS